MPCTSCYKHCLLTAHHSAVSVSVLSVSLSSVPYCVFAAGVALVAIVADVVACVAAVVVAAAVCCVGGASRSI